MNTKAVSWEIVDLHTTNTVASFIVEQNAIDAFAYYDDDEYALIPLDKDGHATSSLHPDWPILDDAGGNK